jgi:hypothetical protein
MPMPAIPQKDARQQCPRGCRRVCGLKGPRVFVERAASAEQSAANGSRSIGFYRHFLSQGIC